MKNFLVSCLLTLMFIFSPHNVCSYTPNDYKAGLHYKYVPPEGSREELYTDIISTLIDPVISKAIEKNYGSPLLYGLYDVTYLDIKREAYRSFSFVIKLEITPFIGAHNYVGVDNITIRISPSGTVLEKFEHIKTLPMPKNLKPYLNSVP